VHLANRSLKEVADYERRFQGCCGPGMPRAGKLSGNGRAGKNSPGQGVGPLPRSVPASQRATRTRTTVSAASASRKPPSKSTARRRRSTG
jgi:hypothetical protein